MLKRKTLGHFQTNLIFMWTPEEAAGWLQEGQSVFPHDSVVSFSLVAPKESEQRIKVKQVLGEELRGPCDNVSLCPEPWLDHPVLDTSRSMLSELGTQLLEELWLLALLRSCRSFLWSCVVSGNLFLHPHPGLEEGWGLRRRKSRGYPHRAVCKPAVVC